MKSFFLLFFCLLLSAPATAHPGWGLVRDPARGVIYYTDLQRVYRIDAKGERSVAVPDAHTHELRLDDAGNLTAKTWRASAAIGGAIARGACRLMGGSWT